jgi:purine nucleoside permease
VARAIRCVVLGAFEPDAGPVPGELRHFIEREGLGERVEFAAGYRDVWWDGGRRGVLACATGVGAARAAASVMALGLDGRFDLTEAHWLVTGVAGCDPGAGSLASVVMPEWVVDGDLGHELDGREIPADWRDGFVPLGKVTPYEEPLGQRFNGDDGIVFRLDEALVGRAFALASEVELLDTEAIGRRRRLFQPEATAWRAPEVLRGDELASTTFWHGRLMSERARRWVAYQTAGRGSYAITAMEDAGILTALKALARAGRVDSGRVVIARGVSNYDRQRVGISAAESLAETRVATDSAYRPALENAWRVGRRLIAELVGA